VDTRTGLDGFGEERNFLPLSGFRTPDLPACSLVVIPSGGIG